MPKDDSKTCKNCKFWYSGTCDQIDMGGDTERHGAVIDADASDDSGLYARLKTSPDFGCTLFQISDKD